MEDLNMADMAQGALFILACAVPPNGVSVSRSNQEYSPAALAIDLDQQSDFSRENTPLLL